MTPQPRRPESSIQLAPPETDLAYYTVAGSSYFLGAVGLLNSLRRVGEQAPLYIVDCGLTDVQRQRLGSRGTVVPADGGLHPYMQKASGPLAHPARVMVLIDADILVTRPLEPLLERARAGKIVAIEDFHNRDRFFETWSSLGLGEAVPSPYVNSGLVAFSWETGRAFLPLFAAMLRSLDLEHTGIHSGSLRYGVAAIAQSLPYFYPDQDLLNALLCTRFRGQTARIDRTLGPFPPFEGILPTRAGVELCAYGDGTIPFALHHTHRKPWLAPVPANAYSRLFSRLVTDPQACLPLTPDELPLRLTDRPLASVDRWRVATQHAARMRLRGRLRLRPRLQRLMARAGASSHVEVNS